MSGSRDDAAHQGVEVELAQAAAFHVPDRDQSALAQIGGSSRKAHRAGCARGFNERADVFTAFGAVFHNPLGLSQGAHQIHQF